MRKFCYLISPAPDSIMVQEVVINGFNEADCNKKISEIDPKNEMIVSNGPMDIIRDFCHTRCSRINGGPKVQWWHQNDYDIYGEIVKFDGNRDFYLNESAEEIQGKWREGDPYPMYLDIRTKCIYDLINNFNPECTINAGEDSILQCTGFINIGEEKSDKDLKFDQEKIYESSFHHVKSHTYAGCDLYKCIITDERFKCKDKEFLYLSQCNWGWGNIVICYTVEQAKNIIDILVNEYGNYETDAYGNQILVIKDFDNEEWEDDER